MELSPRFPCKAFTRQVSQQALLMFPSWVPIMEYLNSLWRFLEGGETNDVETGFGADEEEEEEYEGTYFFFSF